MSTGSTAELFMSDHIEARVPVADITAKCAVSNVETILSRCCCHGVHLVPGFASSVACWSPIWRSCTCLKAVLEAITAIMLSHHADTGFDDTYMLVRLTSDEQLDTFMWCHSQVRSGGTSAGSDAAAQRGG